MSLHHNKRILREMFAAFTDFTVPLDRVLAFMTPDYRQCVDGQDMTLTDFQTHTQALRNALCRLSIDIQHCVCEGDKAATVHVAHAIRHSGTESLIKVVAFYRFRAGRICLVDELTHVLQGHGKDKNLGGFQ
ncbi:nuclear transport factor 2 family protein [Acetobacter orientalis]|uniref:nuclear transport factor 2 family protein n=1 Tax=Acetobacter orientalis TaxID=146474 RepID=UPI0020A0D110|nr:nuclear transport factor 2 family protein [Acetobacter orientalis]MCP1215950.1 nuclear transport factor 2 family protein [Acetobacter orientalis]MCP1217890.1 nuclear transport factor 2 family protein [Acetobacter orientalis]